MPWVAAQDSNWSIRDECIELAGLHRVYLGVRGHQDFDGYDTLLHCGFMAAKTRNPAHP